MAGRCFTAEDLLCTNSPFEGTWVINFLFIQLLNKLKLLWGMEEHSIESLLKINSIRVKMWEWISLTTKWSFNLSLIMSAQKIIIIFKTKMFIFCKTGTNFCLELWEILKLEFYWRKTKQKSSLERGWDREN